MNRRGFLHAAGLSLLVPAAIAEDLRHPGRRFFLPPRRRTIYLRPTGGDDTEMVRIASIDHEVLLFSPGVFRFDMGGILLDERTLEAGGEKTLVGSGHKTLFAGPGLSLHSDTLGFPSWKRSANRAWLARGIGW